jgi:CheY-like chemotaxis protein
MCDGNVHSVLVVEDDGQVRETLASVLADEGYRPVEAANGAEALELLERGERPCLILLDLTMPVMDGWTFREKQSNTPELAALPVVLVSAIERLSREADELKVQGYLAKPVSLESPPSGGSAREVSVDRAGASA